MVNIIKLTNDNYKREIEDKEYLVIKFYADWCVPCQNYKAIYEEVAEKQTDINIAECNIEEAKRVAVSYGIRTIPNTIIVKNKEKIAERFGILTREELENFIKDNTINK